MCVYACVGVCVCMCVHACLHILKMVSSKNTLVSDRPNPADANTHTHSKVSNSIPGNECDFYLRLLVLRHQSADNMWWLMGDGCCHLVVSLLGWRKSRGGGRNYLHRFQKMQNCGSKMSELGIVNRRQTSHVVVCMFSMSVVGVNVRGKKCSSPLATDKSHLSHRSPYKTWETLHICC